MRDNLATHIDNRMIRLVDIMTRWMYLASGGRLGHHQLGWSALLLTTTGRRTHAPRVHTLIYMTHQADLVVVASNNGADTHPQWYLNLCVSPRVSVQYGRQKGPFLARTASPEERQTLWPKLIVYHNPYRHHQEKTAREIPVVILSPDVGSDRRQGRDI